MSPNGCPVDQEENIETNDKKINIEKIEKKDGINTIKIDRS
ncbi:MAG: hypothetical protein ACOCWZ_03110 [Spirochaetota bacterium]